MLGLGAISEAALCELPLPFVPPPVVIAPNIPGGKIIYVVCEPSIAAPVIISGYAPRDPISLSDPNPTIFLHAGRDLSEASNLALTMTNPSGATETFAANVLVGRNQWFTPAGIFPASQYAVYVFGNEIDQTGTWAVSLAWRDAAGTPQTSGAAQFTISR